MDMRHAAMEIAMPGGCPPLLPRSKKGPAMIDDPPLITLRRSSRRPSPDQIAALTGVPTGFAVDALGGRGAMAAVIKPAVPEQSVFCGVALTCDCGPADNLAVFAALPWLQPGDVIVAVTGAFLEAAVTG